jgi:hypothetical protein
MQYILTVVIGPIMLSVIMLNVIMMNVIMLNVEAPFSFLLFYKNDFLSLYQGRLRKENI